MSTRERMPVGDAAGALTVALLIAELQKYDPALPVAIQGCDCYGFAESVAEAAQRDIDEFEFMPRRVEIRR